MSSAPVEPRVWTAGRWWTAIALVFLVQAVLVVCLADRSPLRVRKPGVAPAFRFSDRATQEWIAVEDPTLFALPHLPGFLGRGLARIPTFRFRPEDWTEPAQYLLLDVGTSVCGSRALFKPTLRRRSRPSPR